MASDSAADPKQALSAESEPSRGIRVVVVERAPTGGAPSVARCVAGLGRRAKIESFQDLAAARAACVGGGVDLVVIDESAGPEVLRWIAELRAAAGPPTLAVARGAELAFLVEAFRAGAADGLVAGRALASELPARARSVLSRSRPRPPAASTDRLERATRNVIQDMNSALLVVDSEGKISFANPMGEGLLEASPGELAGRRLADWFPDVPAAERYVERTLREGTRFRGAETFLTRSHGQRVPIGFSCAPLVGDPPSDGAVVVLEDLSELQQLQRQVLQTEKMASIGQLAAGVAHEINNPMGFIHANLCQLSEYLDDLGRVWERVGALRKRLADPAESPAAVRDAAAELEALIAEVDAEFLIGDFTTAIRESLEGSERIRHIVQDLRAFSHQDTAERVLTDVNKALDSTANIVWTMLKHSVVLTKQYDELPPIACYPMQLKQVFMNLLVNASQAIEARMAEEELRGEIRLRTELLSNGVRISVSDNGGGIPPGVIERIFDPFFTTKEVGQGTGLGLSTSYNLVEKHGGTLTVESHPGQGASFQVWLPLGDDSEAVA